MTYVNIPSTVTAIQKGAFYGCESLTKIALPKGLITIGENAFENSGLTTVEIPNSVVMIEKQAFSNCKIDTVVLPESLVSIGYHAFYGGGANVYYPKTVICKAVTPPTAVPSSSGGSYNPIGNEPKYNKDLKVYVPAESVEAYKAAKGWSAYKDVIFAITE